MKLPLLAEKGMRFRCFRPRASATSRTSCRCRPSCGAAASGCRCRRCAAAAQGIARRTVLRRIGRADLRPYAGRAARVPVDRRGWRRPGDGGRARDRGNDGEDASASRVRQDGRFASGRSRQACGGDSPIRSSTRLLIVSSRLNLSLPRRTSQEPLGMMNISPSPCVTIGSSDAPTSKTVRVDRDNL